MDENRVRAHLERYLGEPTRLTHLAYGPLHVLSFLDRPVRDCVTHVTLGLSRRTLHQVSGPVRQELLAICDASWESPGIAPLLAYIAGQIALEERPVLFGEIVPVDFRVVGLPSITTLMALDPRYFDEGLYGFEIEGTKVAVTWLVPITEAEARFATTEGIDAFLALVEAQQPNLFKVRTKSLQGIE